MFARFEIFFEETIEEVHSRKCVLILVSSMDYNLSDSQSTKYYFFLLSNQLLLATWSELMVTKFQMSWSNVVKRKPSSYPRRLHHLPRLLAGKSCHHNTIVPVPSVKRSLKELSKLPIDFLVSNPFLFWSDVDDAVLFESLHHHFQLSLDPSSSLVDEQSCPACVGTSLCPQVFMYFVFVYFLFVYLCGN